MQDTVLNWYFEEKNFIIQAVGGVHVKIRLEKREELDMEEIVIQCQKPESPMMTALLKQLEVYEGVFVGYQAGKAYQLYLRDVFYFECVDEKTFAYLENGVYESMSRLYEWEERLKRTKFVRISKAMILNTEKLQSVCPTFSGKLEVVLENGEKQLINRHYVAMFRKQFGI